MGYFKKKLLVVLLLFLFISCFLSSSVKANTYYQTDDAYKVDVNQLLKDNQNNLTKIFLYKMERYCSDTTIENFKSYLTNNYFTYFLWSYNTNDPSINTITCYFIPTSTNFALLDGNEVNTNIRFYDQAYELIPVTGYNIPVGKGVILYRFNLRDSEMILEDYVATSPTFCPNSLIYNTNDILSNYKNGIMPSDNIWGMLFSSIQENTEQQAETTEEMKKLNDFMSSDDVDEDSYNMPTNNPTQDVTDSGFNGIFTKLYNKISAWDGDGVEGISYPIPFTNQRIYVRADLTENIINNWGQLKTLLNLVWFVLVSLYIVKDVQKYIDGLKTGEILSKSDTNIKTELL